MKKKLRTLAKELEFGFEWEYYDYIISSYDNGQREQCINLFNAMRKADQKDFMLNYLVDKSITEYILTHSVFA